ncbi:MAG: hypothetical protein GY811_16740 [Myxococcales bacterium]|nr:hypothetical protein [Myxococcales bacterium]
MVEVGPDGWSVIEDSPVRFIRAAGMLPLPKPERGGSLDALRTLINATDETWILIKAWAVGAIRTVGSFPILLTTGEQGSAKTTLAKMLRRMIDPNKADLRSPPRSEQDLVIGASHGWALAYDNISYLPAPLSDALCRMSTGGGFATRKLYCDDEEVIFDAKRPLLLNGIEDFATRPDLLDRSIITHL